MESFSSQIESSLANRRESILFSKRQLLRDPCHQNGTVLEHTNVWQLTMALTCIPGMHSVPHYYNVAFNTLGNVSCKMDDPCTVWLRILQTLDVNRVSDMR